MRPPPTCCCTGRSSGRYGEGMILIVVKYRTKPEYTEQFPEIVREFTEATRAEPGNIFFEWSRSR